MNVTSTATGKSARGGTQAALNTLNFQPLLQVVLQNYKVSSINSLCMYGDRGVMLEAASVDAAEMSTVVERKLHRHMGGQLEKGYEKGCCRQIPAGK
jgi:hypothetical protein